MKGITVKAAAEMLKVSRPTIYAALRDGRLTRPLTREQLEHYQPGKVGQPIKHPRRELEPLTEQARARLAHALAKVKTIKSDDGVAHS